MNRPRVLVACEFSGTVRDAFAARGWEAWSCDLLPSEKPGAHYMGDVALMLQRRWDLVIGHPPCTRLANSGVRWLGERGLWEDMRQAARFFNSILNCNADAVCVENPQPHGYALELVGKYTQSIQPWQFGHGETKRTCLWLRGLPNLEPTSIVDGRDQRVHKMSPGPDRWRERSRTYQGIADAMAAQWGPLYGC